MADHPLSCIYTRAAGWHTDIPFDEAKALIGTEGMVEFDSEGYDGTTLRAAISCAEITHVEDMSDERWQRSLANYMARREREESAARMAAAMESVAEGQHRMVDGLEGESG